MQYNKYTPAIEALLKENRPAIGQRRVFEVVGKQVVPLPDGKTRTLVKNFVQVKPTDRIRDPKTGEFIDIAYRPRVVPKRDKDGFTKDTIQFGKIQFKRENSGEIKILGDNPNDIELFDYLFLSNWNLTNKDKPWHLAPKNYTFILKDEKMTAAQKLAFDKKVRTAKDIIDSFTQEEVIHFVEKYGIQGVNPYSSVEEGRLALHRLAERQPDEIIRSKSDNKLELDIFVEKLIKKDLVESGSNKWYLKETGEVLFNRAPSDSYDEALKKWLKTPDGEAFRKEIEKKF